MKDHVPKFGRDDGEYSKAYKNQGEQNFRTGQEHYQETIDKRPLVARHPVDGSEYFYPMFIYLYKAWVNGELMSDKEFDVFFERLNSVVTRSRYMVHHVFREGDLLFIGPTNHKPP